MPAKHGSGKSLAEQIAELEDPTPKDFDPENQSDRSEGSDDESAQGSDSDAAAIAGREHYEAVGKSKLRKPEPIDLGRDYTGSRVSRDALYGDEVDDERFRSESTDASDGSDEGESEGGFGSEEEDIHRKEEEHASTDESEEDDESGEEISKKKQEEKRPLPDDREELRRLMASDHKTVAASISQASKADAAKGLAVKRQRAAFDAVLNTRIKLQKGLTAASDVPLADEGTTSVDENAVKAVEAAAMTLWNTLDDLRHALATAQSTQAASSSSKKRKRTAAPTFETASSDIWAHMREFEADCFTHRRAILDKWSRKARSSKAVAPNARGKLLNTGGDQQSLTAILDAHAAAESDAYGSSSKRTRTESNPQNSNETNANSGPDARALHDDLNFYNTLLRDLVEQRMSSTNGGVADNLHLQIPTRLSINPVNGMRKDKVKRAVDTKASKGRKMRYTVHEKLQNFMAPEERGSWSDRAREEFFASLLGKSASAVLGEDEDDEEALANGAEAEYEDLEESGLRLFRS